MAATRALALALAGLVGLAAAGTAAATTGPTATLSSGNLFMGTTKVEAGARANGSFGSTVSAPAGYSPRTDTGTILGFRVNPDECAWGDAGCVTRGDFFTPGTPYEAWGIQIGSGSPAFNDNSGTGVAGSFTSVDPSGVRGVWQSSGSFGGAIAVRLTYSLPPYGWLIDTTAELTNTSGAAVQDVYLMRGLDPDNCRTESQSVCDTNGDGTADGSASFMTRNTIVAQGSATTTALVTATQTNDSYLGLRPLGSEGRVVRKNSNFSNPASIAAIWSGTDGAYTATAGNSGFGDAGIYGVVRVPSIAPGATATVRIQYVVKEIPAAADMAQASPQAGVLVDVLARNAPGATIQGICTAPSHGTAVVEGGAIRYVPTPGYSGPDSFEYSTGGPCGRVSLTVEPPPPAAPAPAPPGTDDRVAVPSAPLTATPAAGTVRVGASLMLPQPGRYTFIYVDPAGKRIGMATGSRVGPRRLASRHSAPVLVTTTEGARVRIAALLVRRAPKGIALRVIRRLPDGRLSELLLRP